MTRRTARRTSAGEAGKPARAAERLLHPIQVVARRTGATIEVLRAWERRYAVVAPARDASGRRLYTDEQIVRIALLRRAVSAGLRIKQAADRSNEELRRFLDEQQSSEPAATRDTTSSALLAEAKRAVRALDPPTLTRVLLHARVDLALPAYLEDVVAPLMVWVGDEWSEGRLRIADEHMAAAVVRSLALQHVETSTGHISSIVIATPTGEAHEIGAVLAACAASSAGWRVVYLGPGSPASEIADAARRSRARAVGLSLVFPQAHPLVVEQLRMLRALLPVESAIFVGGRSAASYEAAIAAIGALRFNDTRQFVRALTRLAT